SLIDTAQAWGAAMPYADRAVPWYEPAAATAQRKCEERLRDLHPHAMARYDRLRAEGMSPADAMRGAAPLFARPARVYDPPHTPRGELGSDAGLGRTEEDRAVAAERGRAADLGGATDMTATAGLDERSEGLASARADAASAAASRARTARTARPWEHD